LTFLGFLEGFGSVLAANFLPPAGTFAAFAGRDLPASTGGGTGVDWPGAFGLDFDGGGMLWLIVNLPTL
jgi:hypothetical protein